MDSLYGKGWRHRAEKYADRGFQGGPQLNVPQARNLPALREPPSLGARSNVPGAAGYRGTRFSLSLKGLARSGALSGIAKLHPWLRAASWAWDFYEFVQRFQGTAPQWSWNGWTSTFSCAGPGEGPYVETYASCGSKMRVGQWTPGTYYVPGYRYAGFMVSTYFYQTPNYWRGIYAGTARKAVPSNDPVHALPYPAMVPGRFPGFATMFVPRISPTVNPMGLPIGVPVATLKPWPASLSHALRDNQNLVDKSSRTYGSVKPREDLDQGLEVGVKGGRAVVKPVVPVKTFPARPGRGVKERKTVMSAKWKGMEWLIGAVTEGGDLVDAFYKALPRKYQAWFPGRKHPVSLKEKMRALYRHFDKVDMEQAGKNMIANELEDRAIGFVGKRSKRLAKDMGLPRGLQVGPWDRGVR